MPKITPDGTKIYNTRDKQYEVEAGLLQVYFNSIEGLKDIVVNSEKGYEDPRIDMMAVLVSSFAINEDEFNELCERRDAEVQEAIDSHPNDPKKRAYAKFTANMKAIVRANTQFDRFMGYRIKQEIMRVEPQQNKEKTEKEYPEAPDKWVGQK